MCEKNFPVSFNFLSWPPNFTSVIAQMSLQCKKGILAFGMNRMNSKAAVFPSLAKRNAARGMELSCTNFAFQVHSGNTS